MKFIHILTLFIGFGLTTAVAQPNHTPPTIAVKIPLGETVLIGDASVTFLKVLQDSRCPPDVSCVWAGEVKILVGVESSTTTKTKKEMVLSNAAIQSDKNQLLSTNEYRLDVLNVTPIPLSNDDKSEVSYVLLVVKSDQTE